MKTVERLEDMSPTGKLRLMQQEDGDIIIVIIPSPDAMSRPRQIEFCANGGQSPRTLEALRNLIDAIELDNKESAQVRG